MGETPSKPSDSEDLTLLAAAESNRTVAAIVESMTLDEKIGQIFQVDWRVFRSSKLVDALMPWAQPWLSTWSSDLPLEVDSGPVEAIITKRVLGSVLGGGGAHPKPNKKF